MRILIIDDDDAVLSVCERVLNQDGHDAVGAGAGASAASLLGGDWDLVLTDIQMPGEVDGLEILRRAKQAGSADVIMMTGAHELDFAVQALRLGAYDFLLKPLDHEVLTAAVRRCGDKRRLSSELAREKALRAEVQEAYRRLERLQRAKDAFGLFVTPAVADFVLSQPEGLPRGGARRRVTALFTDVRKFTPFMASVSPEEAVEAVNEVFSCVVTAVQAHGGIVNKFMGDGVLALFGAPLDLDGHEAAAARAALDAAAAVGDCARQRRSQGRPPLEIGLGLETGDVVAGCLGTPKRSEYGVIGQAVNLASRLCGAAGPGQVLLGPEAAAACRDLPRRSVGLVTLAGLSEPVWVWELLAQEQGARGKS